MPPQQIATSTAASSSRILLVPRHSQLDPMAAFCFLRAVIVCVLAPTLLAGQRPSGVLPPRSAVPVVVDSAYDAFTDRTTITALSVPRLALNTRTAMMPVWACVRNAPCALEGIQVVALLTDDRGSARDGASAERYWNEVVRRSAVAWDFVIFGVADTVRFSWTVDSLAYRGRGSETRDSVASGMIRTPAIVAALLSGRLLLVRQRTPGEGEAPSTVVEITGGTRWLHAVQAGQRMLVDQRAAPLKLARAKAGGGGSDSEAEHPSKRSAKAGVDDEDTGSAAADTVYDNALVDRPASPIPESGSPAYPETLKSSGVEGETRVQFVVDTAGRPELSSFAVVEASHAAFGQAVRAALPRMRFMPAEHRGRKVRVVVQQPFSFALNR